MPMQLELVSDINRIRALMATDMLDIAMAQFPDMPFDIQDIGTSNHIIISDNEMDIGIFILDRLSYKNHYSVHVGFIKSARGFQAYAGGMLFIDFVKQLLPHGCILGMIPTIKEPAITFGLKIGFKLLAIVPDSIEINHNITDSERVDMAIVAFNW